MEDLWEFEKSFEGLEKGFVIPWVVQNTLEEG